MARIKLEVISWLTRAFSSKESSRLVLEEAVEAGNTVRDLFDRLAAENPVFAEYVFNREKQEITGHVSVIFNDRILELLDGLDTEVKDGDTVTLLPAFSGGS
ncbi:MAG: MoaD/ThiS family protein [Dehalococcoidia bacterium]